MIGILGGGAFGTALAVTLATKEPVIMWTRSAPAAVLMRDTRENAAYLPGISLPDRITITADIAALSGCDVLLLAVPMQKLRAVLKTYRNDLPAVPLVACCKGIELQTGLGPHQVIADVLGPVPVALLTGPSFATDIALGLPTALTLAATDGAALQARLSTPTMRLYRTDDLTGAAMGGALKNVIAIACGAAIGAGLGASARAALMTRGYAEMVRYAKAQGARPATLAGLSGFGDLALTCTSEGSRNYRLGLAMGQQANPDPALTVEGAATARAVTQAAAKQHIDMPITGGVVALLDAAETLAGVMERLLTRPLKEE